MKHLFCILILLHGLIHLMGFLKAFQITEMNQLQTPISKPMGILWLNGTMNCVPWQTPLKAYKSVNGYYLPSQAELVYNYPGGDLCYGMFSLKNIKYNSIKQ